MTKITIHGQKMQYHKKTAISVTLTSGTGGTATFFPETGTSYTLSSLPIGSKIAKAASSLYVITNSSGTTLGSISLSESPGYEISDCDIVRGGVHVAISNTTLENGDTIEAVFKASTMRITFYNGGLGTFYNNITGQNIPDGYYADVPRADVLRFNPSGPNDGAIEIFKDGLWTPTIIYMYNGKQAYVYAADSSAGQVQPAEFAPEPGYTYEFPTLWNLPSGYQYLDGSTFAFQNSPTPPCEVVKLQDMSIQSTEFTQTIEYALQSKYSFIKQIQWTSPQNGQMYYTFYDGLLFHMICKASVMLMTQSGMIINGAVIVAFSTDNKSTPYLTMYDYDGQIYQGYPDIPKWKDTGYPYYGENPWNDVYSNNSQQALGQLMSMWNCQDVCELTTIIYNLATNK